ncbi:hypothetical protein STEG23_006867, partial [Scotinomys teguina]
KMDSGRPLEQGVEMKWKYGACFKVPAPPVRGLPNFYSRHCSVSIPEAELENSAM